jgi:hypothetical protein
MTRILPMNPTRNRLNLNPMNLILMSRSHLSLTRNRSNPNLMNRTRLNRNRNLNRNLIRMNRSRQNLNLTSLIRMNLILMSPNLMNLNLTRHRSNPIRNYQNLTPMSRSPMSPIRNRQTRLRH